MNKIIKEQLAECKVADLSGFDYKTGKGIIPRVAYEQLKEDSCYIIKLDNTLVHPNIDDAFHINWNRGILPPSDTLLIEVSKVVGKVAKVNGVSYDVATNTTSDTWDGWLPFDRISILKKL